MSRSFWMRLALAQLSLSLTCLVAVGCGDKGKPASSTDAKPDINNAKPVSLQPAAPSGPLAHLDMPFKEATVDPPEDAETPPTKTVTGKNVARLYEQIVGNEGKGGLWEKIKFISAEGKRIKYQAHIKTDQGTMTLDFHADDAPNHVRSFIALAKVGYFDGLPFHHLLNSSVEGQKWTYIEAACPLGTGEPGQGSIGYWLLPEISEKLVHDEGTVGAWHGPTLESAACKFYISLTKAPWMDGGYTIFGKITQGLDVARKISQGPVEEGFRAKEPVLMREVTITSTEDASVMARNP